MTTITFEAHTRTWTLTDEASSSRYGIPVLIDDAGQQLGPWDYAVKNIQRGELGFLHGFIARARAVAEYALEDYPDDPVILAMVTKFRAVPEHA